MKNKILLVLLTLVLALSTLTGCNKIKLKDNPATSAPITSNGGLVVQKGDYLYFANGYTSKDSLKNGDNKYNEVTYSAIYRAKTTSSELNYEVKIEDEKEVKTLKDVDLLIPKVVSSEYGNFFIFDDYIYYASPTIEKDKTGNSRFDLITFFCCKIDGTGTKKSYAVDKFGTSAKFNMIKVENRVYIEIFDGTDIKIVSVEGNKVKDKFTVSENSTFSEVVFPNESTYNQSNNTINENKTFVYYTRSIKDSENYANCNVLCRASVKNGIEEILVADSKNTISLKGYNNGYLFYTSTDKDSLYETYICYASQISTIKENGVLVSDQISFLNPTNSYVITDSNYIGNILVTENDVKVCLKDSGNKAEVIFSGKFTVLAVNGEYVYGYDSSNSIFMINFVTKESKQLTNDTITPYFDAKTNFDICGGFMYCFNTYTGDSETGYYLNRTNMTMADINTELLGVIDSKYIKTETEE